MKVKIGPYVNWYGPYQIAETILFWKDKDDDAVFDFGKWLATNRKGGDSWLNKFCRWIDSKRERKVSIHIDNYDVWSMDNTLAMIIVPMLEKLRGNSVGSPWVDDEDVPENLRSTAAPPLTEEEKNCGHTDENWFERWEWVLDEMIWTFQQHMGDDWKEQYESGTYDSTFVKNNDDNFSTMKFGPNHTHKTDYEGIKKHQERMDNGRRLFAKYYQGLWY
jgi:hypothetical protein